MRTTHFSNSGEGSSYRDPHWTETPLDRDPHWTETPQKEHGTRNRDPLEGTWDQAAK